MATKINDVVSAYRKLRDLRAKNKKEFELADQVHADKMQLLEAYMLEQTALLGVDSFKTEDGTAYKYHATSVTTSDWDTTFNFIRTNELWNMIEHRVSKKAVEEYKEVNEVYPPGLNIVTIAKMGFRTN